MWRRCAMGVPSPKRLGLITPNGAVKRAFRKTDPVKRTARNTSARMSWVSHAVSGAPAKQGNVLVMVRLGLQREIQGRAHPPLVRRWRGPSVRLCLADCSTRAGARTDGRLTSYRAALFSWSGTAEA